MSLTTDMRSDQCTDETKCTGACIQGRTADTAGVECGK